MIFKFSFGFCFLGRSPAFLPANATMRLICEHICGPLEGEENDARCFIDVSVNGGYTWTPLTSFGGSVTAWTLETVSLEALCGHDGVKLRFRIGQHATSGGSTRWIIDDLTISAH